MKNNIKMNNIKTIIEQWMKNTYEKRIQHEGKTKERKRKTNEHARRNTRTTKEQRRNYLGKTKGNDRNDGRKHDGTTYEQTRKQQMTNARKTKVKRRINEGKTIRNTRTRKTNGKPSENRVRSFQIFLSLGIDHHFNIVLSILNIKKRSHHFVLIKLVVMV